MSSDLYTSDDEASNTDASNVDKILKDLNEIFSTLTLSETLTDLKLWKLPVSQCFNLRTQMNLEKDLTNGRINLDEEEEEDQDEGEDEDDDDDNKNTKPKKPQIHPDFKTAYTVAQAFLQSIIKMYKRTNLLNISIRNPTFDHPSNSSTFKILKPFQVFDLESKNSSVYSEHYLEQKMGEISEKAPSFDSCYLFRSLDMKGVTSFNEDTSTKPKEKPKSQTNQKFSSTNNLKNTDLLQIKITACKFCVEDHWKKFLPPEFKKSKPLSLLQIFEFPEFCQCHCEKKHLFVVNVNSGLGDSEGSDSVTNMVAGAVATNVGSKNSYKTSYKSSQSVSTVENYKNNLFTDIRESSFNEIFKDILAKYHQHLNTGLYKAHKVLGNFETIDNGKTWCLLLRADAMKNRSWNE